MLKEIYTFKADNKNVNFPTQLWLGSISDKFGINYIKEESFKGNLCDFPVYYNGTDKINILKIHKYLFKNNI